MTEENTTGRRPSGEAPRDGSELDILLAEYIDQLNSGVALDPAAIRARHPELAAELLSNLEAFRGIELELGECEALGTLGDYDLRREIGRGGMGVVYEAWQSSMDRQVALKVLPIGVAADERAVNRFIREAQAAGRIDHPNVVRVYGMGVEEKTPYYAMEYVDGETLAQLLRRIRAVDDDVETPFGRRRELPFYALLASAFADVADGLQHAHSKGITHRDIKPSNLIVDHESRLRILDFGLAHLEGHESLTASGDVVGTPLYMSPEQARRQKVEIDHRTDVYSLGATMYEAFTSRPPFRGKDHADTLSQIIERDAPALRTVNPLVPKSLEMVVLKCLRKSAGDRYGTAEALAQDLRRFVRGDPVEAKPEAAWERVARRVVKHRRRVIVAAALSLLLVLVGVGSYVWIAEERGRRAEELSDVLNQALEHAVLLHGEARVAPDEDPAKWEQALVEVRSAEEIARSDLVSDADRTRVRELKRTLERGKEDARAAVARAAEDAAMVESLARLGDGSGGHVPLHLQEAEYTTAFRGYGLDLDAQEATELARRIKTSRIAEELCAALDTWAWLRRSLKDEDGARRLLEIARAADGNPWRRRARSAILDGDQDELEELARTVHRGELEPRAVTLVVQALQHTQRDREATIELLEGAALRYPDNFWIANSLGNILTRKDDPAAIGYLRVAIGLRPASVAARDRLGMALTAGGDVDGAIAVWREALRINPGYVHVFEHLIPALKDRGVEVTEIEALRDALDFDAADSRLFVGVAMAFERTGAWAKAVDAYREAARLQESGATCYHLGAGLFRKALCDSCLGEEKKGDVLEEAATVCERALQLYDEERASTWDRAVAWTQLGHVRAVLEQPLRAIDAYKTAVDLEHCYRPSYRLLDLLLQAGSLSEAKDYYERGLACGFTLRGFPNAYAARLRQAGKLEEAREFSAREALRLRALTERDPHDVWSKITLGGLLQDQLRDFDGAIHEAAKAIDLQPTNREGYRLLAVARFNKGELTATIDALEKYVELADPRAGWRTRAFLASVYQLAGGLDRAAAHARGSLEFGETAELNRTLGFALLGTGQTDEGRARLERYGELEEWSEAAFYPRERWDTDCVALVRLAGRLPSILRGEDAVETARDRARLAWLLQETGYHARAARVYLETLAEDAGLADEPSPFTSRHPGTVRVAAIAAAARAGAGQGAEAKTLSASERAEWRRQAIEWLREELARWEKELDGATDDRRRLVWSALWYLKTTDVACSLLRYEGNLAALPEQERQACRALWQGVDRVLALAKSDAARPSDLATRESETGPDRH